MTTVYSITATQKIVDDPLMLDYNIAMPSEDMPAGMEVMAHTGGTHVYWWGVVKKDHLGLF